MNPRIPPDFLTMSVLETCSSLVRTESRLVAAQKPTPIAQPCNNKYSLSSGVVRALDNTGAADGKTRGQGGGGRGWPPKTKYWFT